MISRLLRWFLLSLPWLIACLCVGAWLVARVPLTGIFQRAFVFDGTSPWFNTFLPSQRVTTPGRQPEGWVGQRIFEEPVYASARLPGVYDEVEVGLQIRPTRQPMLEFGLANRDGDQFTVLPVWSEVLQRGWHRVVSIDDGVCS